MAEIVEKRIIPTVPMRIVGRVSEPLGAGTRQAIGSVIVPINKQGQLTYLALATGTSNVWFQISAMKGSILGTVDYHYHAGIPSRGGSPEVSGGEIVLQGNIYEPLESFESGTVIISVFSDAAKTGSTSYSAKARIDLV